MPAKLHAHGKTRIREAQRRDARTSRGVAPATLGPETDAAFGRKRETSIAAVAEGSASKRVRILAKTLLGARNLVVAPKSHRREGTWKFETKVVFFLLRQCFDVRASPVFDAVDQGRRGLHEHELRIF